MIKVSIVVPLHNSEKYLEKCISSLLDQTLRECEFILVNDGSTDLSGEIADRFAALDSRVKTIHQNNLGVSAARNAGIKASSGEYIGFVDSDDWIEPDMYQELYNYAIRYDCDMSFCNFSYMVNGDIGSIKYQFEKWCPLDRRYINDVIIPFLIEYDTFNTVCTKINKAGLIKDKKCNFDQGMVLGEDQTFNLNFLSIAHKIIYIDYIGYHYNENLKSATRDKDHLVYFSNILSCYKSGLLNKFAKHLNANSVSLLNSKRLIRNTLSLIHVVVYSETNFKIKLTIINTMIHDASVKDALKNSFDSIIKEEREYTKILLYLLKFKCVLLTYFLISFVKEKGNLYKRMVRHE